MSVHPHRSVHDDAVMTAPDVPGTFPPGYRPLDLGADRAPDVIAMDAWAFPSATADETVLSWPSPLTWDRVRGVATDDGELVAMHASYPFSRFPVPGARVPVAGLTWVGVHPGHRRRGLLRAMVADHVRRSLARGEPVSALFAAELGIYGRFGYGLAARELVLEVPRGAALRDVPGAGDVRVRLERVDPAVHGPVVMRLHGAVDRPGWATPETDELRAMWLHDPEQLRDGFEPLRIALAERDGETVGYALFRRRVSWDPPGPRGTVRARGVVAQDPAVARALWGVLTDLDLMATTTVRGLAVDDPISQLLVDVRAAQPRLMDNVWVRLLDVPAALRARRYAAPVDVVLQVHDTLVPANAGRWRVRAGEDGTAEVGRTDDDPDLALDVRDLGAAYLGGVSLASLATAGMVTEHRDGALARASTAFGWPLAPVCSWVF